MSEPPAGDRDPPHANLVDWAWWFSGLHHARLLHASRGCDLLERLERARTRIHGDYHGPLDVDALAREAAFSRYHFIRSFRRQFDLTPRQYLIRRRIEAAQELLLSTDASVLDICLAVGFESLGSFTTSFTRHVGFPPGRYRRQIFACPGIPAPPIPGCFMSFFGVPGDRAHFEKSPGHAPR